MPVAVRRFGYRSAYRILQVIWFVFRPTKIGVKCLLTHDERILLVRHTYGRRSWDLPGGAVKRGEPPLDAARREMTEELGIETADWTALGELHGRVDRRRDTIHLFTAELHSPALVVDRGELGAVGWFALDALPDDLSPYVAPIVSRAPRVAPA